MKERKAVISIFLITMILMATGSVFPTPKSGVCNWAMCNWGITYETGFIYRGLIGTVFTFIFGMMTAKKIYYLSLVLLLVMYFIFSIVFVKTYKRNTGTYSFLLILFIAALPSNIRWWIADAIYGRLDMFISIIAFISLILILKIKNKKLLLPLLFVLSLVAMLIHEGFGVIFASMIFALAMLEFNKNSDKLVLSPLFAYYVPTMAVFAVIIIFGGRDASPKTISAVFEKNVSASFSFSMPIVVKGIITDSFSQKVQQVKSIQTTKMNLSLILNSVALLPALSIFAGIFTNMFKAETKAKNKILLIIAVGSCFAPICACFFGIDFFRWIGFFIICLSSIIIFLYFSKEKFTTAILKFVERNKYYLAVVVVLYLSLSVLHDMYGISYIETIVSRIYS